MEKAVITANDLCIGYRQGKQEKRIHEHLSFRLYPGELTCLLGANGTGKSTLLRTLAASQPALSGELFVQEKPLSAYSEKERSRTIGVVLTDKTQAGGLTVYELVALGRQPHTGFFGRLNKTDHSIIEEALEAVSISHKAHSYTAELSDGERQKVMIAKALVQECPLILLDEPTAFLDFPSKVEMMQLLHQLSRQTDKTIFLSTHDLELALQIADKIWLMDKVNGVTIGTPEDLSLNGSLSNFFARKGIAFDLETGLFRVANEYTSQIRLAGHGQKYAMVRKALQRNGILANRNVESEIYIETGDLKGDGSFVFHRPGKEPVTVYSIEKLLQIVLSFHSL